MELWIVRCYQLEQAVEQEMVSWRWFEENWRHINDTPTNKIQLYIMEEIGIDNGTKYNIFLFQNMLDYWPSVSLRGELF